MTIDLRYIIPIVAFYLPGLLMLFGGWALGYSLQEMRDFVAGCGVIFGAGAAITLAGHLSECAPILVTIFGGATND